MMYGTLCTEFYNADKKMAPPDEVDFYKTLFKTADLILEPMCGSGRLLIPLLREGYTVHGIDNSSDMLKSCRERAAAFGLEPTLIEARIEEAFLPDKYDGIIIPFGSFQLFYPRSLAFQMLEQFKTLLKPNGKLVMDLSVPWHSLGENTEESTFHREVKTAENTLIRIDGINKVHKYEQYTQGVSTYTKWVDGRVVVREEEQMNICWYYRYEMELILEKYGFKNVQLAERYLNHRNQMTFVAELK